MAGILGMVVRLWFPHLTRKEKQVSDEAQTPNEPAPGYFPPAPETQAEETDETKDAEAPAEGADAADPYAHLGSDAPTGDKPEAETEEGAAAGEAEA